MTATTTNDGVLVLTVRSQKTPGEKVFRLHKRRVVLGSATSSDVRLEDLSVSPVHAILEASGIDKKPVIYDLASDSGVLVNGQPVVQATLEPNDKVQIGPFLLTVRSQTLSDVPQAPQFMRETQQGQKLFIDEKEDFRPLILEDESDVIDIFDHRPEAKKSLQVVMFFDDMILDVEHFVKKRKVIIGPGAKEDFSIPPFFGSGKSGRYELVSFDGNDACTLNLHPSMSGVVSRDGQVSSVKADQSQPVTLREKDFAKVKIKDMSFFLSFTQAPPRLKAAKLGRKDPLFARMMVLSIASTIALIATVSGITVDPTIEIEQLPERVATIIYEPKFLPIERPPVPVAKTEPQPTQETKPQKTKVDIVDVKKPEEPAPKNAMIGVKPEQEKPTPKKAAPVSKPAPKPRIAGRAGGQEGAGAKAQGPEGSRGKPDSNRQGAAQTKAVRPGEGKKPSGLASSPGRSQTNSVGVVDVFKSSAGTLSKIFAGGKGASTAADKLEGYSGFTTRGGGGLGAAGSGAGGGGTSMGLGGLAEKGPGGGKQGKGLGALGSGGNLLGGKGTLAIDSGGSAEPIVLGAIDTSAIARAIDRHRDEIKYCYEKEINADRPDLSGRVVMRFEIGASGTVSSAGVAATTLRHAATEQCIVEVIKRIQFPPVAGGGETDVTFPFVFKPTNK